MKHNPETENQETSEATTDEATRITELEAEVAQLKDQWVRSMAEIENVRKRAEKEREDAVRYAASNFSRDILQVADNLRRALESCPLTGDMPEAIKSLIQGIEMTENTLISTFERYGIKTINPINEKFDANYHQAMFEIEDHEKESGIVAQVLQIGYVHHDRLLRPAMVGVTKKPAAPSE